MEKRKKSLRINRINQEICSKEIRLIGFHGEQIGLIDLRAAIENAKAIGVDIVEINSNTKPPLCRMIDFGKFLYEKHKLFKERKKKQKIIQIKEIKFRPNTDVSDYQTKLRNLTRFLKNGDKVKITVRFRGREITHQKVGMKIFDRIQKDLQSLSSIESFPKRIENRQMVMILIPKK